MESTPIVAWSGRQARHATRRQSRLYCNRTGKVSRVREGVQVREVDIPSQQKAARGCSLYSQICSPEIDAIVKEKPWGLVAMSFRHGAPVRERLSVQYCC